MSASPVQLGFAHLVIMIDDLLPFIYDCVCLKFPVSKDMGVSMDSVTVDRLRQELTQFFDEIQPEFADLFPWRWRRFWHYIHSRPVFHTMLVEMEIRQRNVMEKVAAILERKTDNPVRSASNLLETLLYDTEELAASSLAVMRRCIESNRDPRVFGKELYIGHLLGAVKRNPAESCRVFKETYIRGLYSYLLDALDRQYLLLYYLIRYKRLCEWFDTNRVHEIYGNNPERTEDYLALDAYRFLFLQGMEFHLSPNCQIGQIDFVSELRSEGRLLFDAKIYRSGRSDIANGFNQVQSYLSHYNQKWGCLLIFDVNGKRPLGFSLPVTDFQIPYAEYNGMTILMIRIDIAKRESASTRGKLKPLVIDYNSLVCG